MSYLLMRYHGGYCCGIKHIHGFGMNIARKEPEINSKPVPLEGGTYIVNIRADKWGSPLTKEPIPEESTVERLDRYLKWCEEQHRFGVTEATLTAGQAKVWEEILLQRGFKKVTECLNSNSCNRICIYHLCRDSPPPKPAAAKEKPLR